MRIWCSLLAALALVSHAAAVDLDGLLARPKLWTLSQDDFQKLPETNGFRWNSAAKDSARAGEQKITLYNLPVVEVNARFENGKLAAVEPILYARGDVGGISKENFEALVKTSAEALNTYTKVKFTERGRDAASAVHAEGLVWEVPTMKYLLEYSFTKEVKTRNIPFRAEFVRLEVKPPEIKNAFIASTMLANKARFSGPAHLKKNLTSGDVVIPDVPMVDQGQKGYCAVACVERMMRYYGIPADENEIAQVANSDASRGTSADAMFAALKKLGARLHVVVRPVEQFEVRQIETLMNEYNRAAKVGHRAKPIPDQGHMLNVGAIYEAMDPTLLKEVRNKNKAESARFQKDIQAHIDQGIPLLWSVMLGLVKEKEIPQSMGGHMRLIIGYNAKTNEVLYTDSWGAGHELKRMAVDDAWTMTTGLTAIEPVQS